MAKANEAALPSALAAKIAAGKTIDLADWPEDLAARPQVQRLLRFARVAQVLVDNAQAPPAEASAPSRIGPWRVLRLLGTGGMGEVWLGERADGAVEHRVAIKCVRGVSPAFTQRLESERRILARLSHPHIARFIDAGVDATGAPWLALDYVEGLGLSDWLDRERPGLASRLRLFLSICEAVDHAHRHLVVHRDLKPANVLVDAEGVPHLLDFGIAKLLDGDSGETTVAGMTPAYAAPEQLRGGEISTATDVYALGLVLFRMLAGDLPATRRDATLAAVLERLDQEETQRPSRHSTHAPSTLPYALSELRGDLDAIVSKALRASPEARYASVRELAADIQRHLDGHPVEARPPTRWYLVSRFARRHRGALSVAMAASLGVLISLGLALWQAQRAEQAAQQARIEAARADAEAEAARRQAQRAERAQRFLVELFASANPEVNQGRMPSVRDLLEHGAQSLQGSVLAAADQHDLALTITESWLAIGDVDAARAMLAQARASSSDDSARARLLAARLALHSGDIAETEAHYQAALELARGERESVILERNEARAGLAQVSLFRGDGRAAQALIEAVAAELTATLGAGHLRSLEAQTALGVASMSVADLDTAVNRLQQTATLARQHLGANHPLLCRVGTSLSDALERQGDADAAYAEALRAITVCQAVYGTTHRRYGQAQLATGFALGKLGRHGEALAHYAAARQAFQAVGHFDEGSALRYAGGTLLSLERHREALTMLQAAERLLAARMGEDAELVLAARLNQAAALRGLRRPAEAQALLTAAWAKLDPKPRENSTRINALRLLGQLAVDRADMSAAQQHYAELREIQGAIHGPQSRPLALAMQLDAQRLVRLGSPADRAQARAWLDQAVAIQTAAAAPAGERVDVLLDRAELLESLDPAAASADRAAARQLAQQIPEPAPSLQARLAR